MLLLVRRTTANRADAVEYAARELLMTVGVDGDAVPAIQSALTSRTASRVTPPR